MRKMIFLLLASIFLFSCHDEVIIHQNDLNQIEAFLVYIDGEVNFPGIYEMNQGDRINDLIEKAGGLTKNASLDNLNILDYLEANHKYFIPSLSSLSTLININTATKEQLMTLPKIGEASALRIIEYRKNHPFQSIDEIKQVSGIKDATFSAIKDYITV